MDIAMCGPSEKARNAQMLSKTVPPSRESSWARWTWAPPDVQSCWDAVVAAVISSFLVGWQPPLTPLSVALPASRIHWLAAWLACWMAGLLACLPACLFDGWLADWFTGLLVGQLAYLLV